MIVRCLLVAAAVAAIVLPQVPAGGQPTAEKKWYKGNLHTHTINSDGDSTPDAVAAWYKENRYNFLILTDHDFVTDPTALNAIHGAAGKFLLIPGEEVTDRFEGKPIHLNALNLPSVLLPAGGKSVVETIQRNVDAIRAAGALPQLNHPNFHWAVSANDLLAVNDLPLMEIFNGHPQTNERGGGGFASLEELWDAALSGGKRTFGVAVDDAHHFKAFAKNLSNPGRGWVMVRASELSTAAIMAALSNGDFYASTGVELESLQVTPTEISLVIKEHLQTRYTTLFIGEGGKVLKTVQGRTASYSLNGTEKYVRAKVLASNGDDAWIQPVFGAQSGPAN